MGRPSWSTSWMRRPCGRLLQHHLMREIGDIGIVLHRLMDRFGGMGEVAVLGRAGVGRAAGLAGAGGAAAVTPLAQRFDRRGGRGRRLLLHHRLGAAGMGGFLAHHLAAQHAAGAGHGLGDGLRREIIGDAALLFGRGGVDQPHQQEEGHHRGDEVGIGDFPGAAMMAAMPALLDALDDDRCRRP